MACPSAEITGNRSTPALALSFRISSIGVSGPHRHGFVDRHHHVGGLDVSKIDDVVDHGALGRGEGAFAFALHGDLFQFLARDEEAGALAGPARE